MSACEVATTHRLMARRMPRKKHPLYSMVIEWSDEDQCYIVSLPEWGPYARTHGHTYAEAVRMGEEALDLLVSSALEEDESLPLPRRFSGVNIPA